MARFGIQNNGPFYPCFILGQGLQTNQFTVRNPITRTFVFRFQNKVLEERRNLV
jgi:hypothetical protein